MITGYTNFHNISLAEALLSIDLEHSDYSKYVCSTK